MNAYFRLYIKSILRLAATLIIKCDYEVSATNKRLKLLGYTVDPDDPYSWKYYMNMAGLYHPYNEGLLKEESGGLTNRIQVVSLDTEEVIDFTIESLKIHRGTKRGYVYGTRKYNDLIAAYPDQVQLINGILNPIDIDAALAAEDHTILFYDKTLVEPAEQRLIPELQRRIYGYFFRYYNPDYTLFEPYYYSGLWAQMAAKLGPWISNIRKRACLSDQAHSFHIRQYLLSFSPVGKEFDYMTPKLRLWLYRNIRYLNLNLGREEILQLVTDHVLTDRGYNLSGYKMDHDYTDLEKNLVPQVIFNRYTRNGIQPSTGDNSKTVTQILDLEEREARDNPVVRGDTLTDYTERATHSLLTGLDTKVLESNVVDRTDSEPFTLSEVVLNHWIYFSHFDLFKSVVSVTNPANGDVYKLSAKNAFIFYLYAYNASNGITLKTVPVVGANRVVRLPIPKVSEIRGMSDKRTVPDYFIDYIFDKQEPIVPYVSIESFREACVAIHKSMLSLRDMRHYQGDYKREGALHAMIDRFYQDIRIDLAAEIPYVDWLENNGIDVRSMGKIEFSVIAGDLLKTATGADLGVSLRMRDVHAAMIRIMETLSSYSVQFIAQINDAPIKIIDGKFPKLSLPYIKNAVEIDIENPMPTILALHETTHQTFEVAAPIPEIKLSSSSSTSIFKIRAYVDVKFVGSHSGSFVVENPLPSISIVVPDIVDLATYGDDTIYGYSAIGSKELSDLVVAADLAGYSELTPARRRNMLGLG